MILTLVVALAASSAAYAYTASNTVGATNAGFGTGSVTAYTVGTAQFNLNWTGDPSSITSFTFPLNPTNAQTVDVKLVNNANWYSCSNAAGTVTCTPTAPQAHVTAALNSMTVDAAQ